MIDGSLHQLHYINGRYELHPMHRIRPEGVDSERFSYDFEESPLEKVFPGQGIYLFFNKGNSTLIFLGLNDPIHEYLYLELRKYMTDLGFSISDWIVISINFHEDINYDNWINVPWLQWSSKCNFLKNTLFEWTEDHIKYLKEKERNFNLLSFNRTNKKPRQEFIEEIVRRNLWDTSLISVHWPIKGLEDYTPNALDYSVEYSQGPHTDYYLNKKDIGQDDLSIDAKTVVYSIPFELLENVFFMVVAESWFGEGVDNKVLSVSEKSFKALVSTPFISFGNMGMLKYLKTQGFKTSSHMFDESYDDIADNTKRFLFVMNEIEKFCQLSYDEKKEKYIKSFDNILHNQKVLLNTPGTLIIDQSENERKYFILEVLKKNRMKIIKESK